jgi:hypothetical protein
MEVHKKEQMAEEIEEKDMEKKREEDRKYREKLLSLSPEE